MEHGLVKKVAVFTLLSLALAAGTVTVLAPQPPAALPCNGQSIDRPTASGNRLCKVRWPLGHGELAHRGVAPGTHRTL